MNYFICWNGKYSVIGSLLESRVMSYKCANSKHGCKFSVQRRPPSAELTGHEQQCDFGRMVQQGDSMTKPGSRRRKNNFECIHSSEGCNFKIEHSELLDHENDCEYRKVQCPDGLCSDVVVLRELVEHIKRVHADADWEEESGDTALRNWFISRELHFGSKSNNWVLNLWEHDRMLFVARFRKLGGLWYSWVTVLGGIRDAMGYRCIINTASAEVDSRLTYEGPVHCIDEPESEVCKSGDCLVMNDAMIDLYMEKVRRIEVFTEGYDGRLPIDYTLKRDDQIA